MSDAQAAASAQRAVRRPKYRPRTVPGTRSPIHEVQALLPATESAALVETQARKSPCLIGSATGSIGRQASGSTL